MSRMTKNTKTVCIFHSHASPLYNTQNALTTRTLPLARLGSLEPES